MFDEGGDEGEVFAGEAIECDGFAGSPGDADQCVDEGPGEEACGVKCGG